MNTYEMLKAFGGAGSHNAPEMYGKAFRQAAQQFKEMNDIAHVLAKAGKPMRVKEICAALEGIPADEWYYGYNTNLVAKCVHRLRLMRRAGLVVRTEVKCAPMEVENPRLWREPELPPTVVITPTVSYYSLAVD